jgi:cyclopropane-fatty-acyl-phospholipid synthase
MNEATRTRDISAVLGSRRVSGWFDTWAARLIRAQLSRIGDGHLTITDPWGTWHFGRPSALGARIVVHAPDVYRRVLVGGTLAAARAYRGGDWSADDAAAVCRIFCRNAHLIDGIDDGWARLTRPWNKLVHRMRPNSRTGSRRNIRAHYDLGNDFFRLFLDDTMSYSCGIFERPNSTMREASIAKMDRICRTLDLQPSDHLVEIGSGWGGLAIHAARHYGCRVTTATVSKAQHALAVERVREAGVGDRVTVLLSDYRDLTGRYDKLVSVEMIEAVGHEYLGAYFETCGRLLEPGGLMLIQAITVPDEHYDKHRRSVDFIQQDIFPGSSIPSIAAMREAMASTDLEIVEIFDITPHYAETLRRWRAAFMSKLDEVRALGLSDDFIRMWEYYLAYTEAGFEERLTGDAQILFAHADGRASARPERGGVR